MEDKSDGDEGVDSLEIEEGDVSMVIRANGGVEFLIACDEDSDGYLTSLRLVHYLKFVLDSPDCKKLFEKHLGNNLN